MALFDFWRAKGLDLKPLGGTDIQKKHRNQSNETTSIELEFLFEKKHLQVSTKRLDSGLGGPAMNTDTHPVEWPVANNMLGFRYQLTPSLGKNHVLIGLLTKPVASSKLRHYIWFNIFFVCFPRWPMSQGCVKTTRDDYTSTFKTFLVSWIHRKPFGHLGSRHNQEKVGFQERWTLKASM